MIYNVFRDRRYFSWLLECSSSQRRMECDVLRSILKDINISFYERFNNDGLRSRFYTWIAPYFPSKDYDDIKYQLCLETFNYYFYKECRDISNNYVYSMLSEEEKELERKNYSLLYNEREHGNVSEIRYRKFNNLTLLEYRDKIFKGYIIHPPDSIKFEVGFSVSHISSNSVLGVGIVDEKFFDDQTTVRVINQFLSLEKEFIPILLSQILPDKKEKERIRDSIDIFPYKKYRGIDPSRIDPEWYIKYKKYLEGDMICPQ